MSRAILVGADGSAADAEGNSTIGEAGHFQTQVAYYFFARRADEEEIDTSEHGEHNSKSPSARGAVVSDTTIPLLRSSRPRGSHAAVHSIHRGPSAPVPPQLSTPSATRAISRGMSSAAVDKVRVTLDQRFNKEGVKKRFTLRSCYEKCSISNNNSNLCPVCMPAPQS